MIPENLTQTHAAEIDTIDLSALVNRIGPNGYAIDERSGLFVSRLPKPSEKYRLVLAPGWEIVYSNTFRNGTEQLTIKRTALVKP